jgi:signal transduction histidine kinase/DNA-binding response OmpR family regulator
VPRLHTSIRGKLALIVIAAVVTAVLLASALSAWRDTRRQLKDKAAELHTIGEALATTIAVPLSQGNSPASTRALSAIGRMPAIRFARIVDATDEPVAEFGIGIVLNTRTAASNSLEQNSIWQTLNLEDYHYSVPVIAGGRQIGRLEIIADISHLSASFRNALENALLIALMAAMLGLVLALPMLLLVTRPLEALTAAMRHVRSTGDFSSVVTIDTKDESKLLVDAFNEMLAEIRSRGQRLAHQRDTLELQVRERTRQLEIATLAAESANEAKSDFLAAMSHEIRTPMHGMLVMTELLQTTELDRRQARFAEMISKAGRGLLAIVNDILDLSKIEAGKMQLESIPLEPTAVARDVVDLFAARAAEKGLALALEASPDVPPWIAGDPVRLNQILSNLVSNAIKFTEQGTVTIALDLSPDRQTLRLSVKDTGIGIPLALRARIFEPFSQAEQSTTRRYGGTGIGLTISRRLAEAMGGKISLQSEDGNGSTFTCAIPVVAVAAPEHRTSANTAPQATFVGLHVLAADDNAINRAVLEEALTRLGAFVVAVENGEAAVAAVSTTRFDLVFMDCSMPVMDGFQAARRIRQLEQQRAAPPIPIVALTAHVIGKNATAWREAGMSDHLAKPFNLDQISAMLSRWTSSVTRVHAQPASSAAPADADENHNEDKNVSPLDRDVIDQFLAMDKAATLMTRLVSLFHQQAPIVLSRLRASVAAGDATGTAAQAHALRSMSLALGARHVSDLAHTMEQDAQTSGKLPDAFKLARAEAAIELAGAALDVVIAPLAPARTPATDAT